MGKGEGFFMSEVDIYDLPGPTDQCRGTLPRAQGRPEPKGRQITNAQIKKIKTLQRVCAMDDDTYRLMLKNVGGVTSSTQLQGKNIQKVMKHLEKLQGKGTSQRAPTRRRENMPNIVELATKKQVDYIYHLAEDIGWFDRKRLFGFIRKRGFGNEKRYTPEMLRKDEAGRLIEALKGMKKRGKS